MRVYLRTRTKVHQRSRKSLSAVQSTSYKNVDRRFSTYDELSRKVKELESKLRTAKESNDPTNAMPKLPTTEESIERLPPEDEAAVDELATQVFNELPERNIGHFGPASNHAFFRTLSSAFAFQIPLMLQSHTSVSRPPFGLNGLAESRSPSPLPARTSSKEDAQHPKVDPFVVPPQKELLDLINRFFATTGAVLPFVDRSVAVSTSDDWVWRTTRSGRALLNIVCAHATLSLNRDTAEVYYHRAVALLDIYTVHGASLELRTSKHFIC
jgi:hypothetical protein